MISRLRRYCLFQLVSLLLFSITSQAGTPAIIPQPKDMTVGPGEVQLTGDTAILAPDEAVPIAKYLQARIASATGMLWTINSGDIAAMSIIFKRSLEEAGSGESYTLEVDRTAITITASEKSGLFYGVQTLLQLLPAQIYGDSPGDITELVIPELIIVDQPRFQWRGLLVDVSRHFVTKPRLFKLIDSMAMHKLNVLHLHLTDDPGWRIEIDKYPKLTEVGAIGNRSDPDATAEFFTRKDIKELVAYAAVRHIEIVPEIDMPGHAGAAARSYPEYFDGNVTFNIGKTETYGFIEDILDEVMALFPGPYLHFGGDELRNHYLEELPEVRELMREHNYQTIEQAEGHFDRHIASYIIKAGKTPIAWDEVTNYDLNRKTIIQWWRGLKPEMLRAAIAQGYQVIMSPVDHVYLDYPQAPGEPGAPWEGNHNGPNSLELIYQWEPVPGYCSTAQEKQILGIEAALWTEFIRTEDYMEYMTYPRLSAVAEVAWSEKDHKDMVEFSQRLTVQYQRYEAMDINYRIPGVNNDPAAKNSAQYLRN